MPSLVTIDANRITHINGKPFFLLGARHMPEGGTPEVLSEAGFNAYRVLAFGHDICEPETTPDPNESIFFWSYLYDRTILGRNPDYKHQLKEYVGIVKNHPHLLCYENTNEVARYWKDSKPSTTPDDLVAGINLLRELDPNHPIWIAHTRHRTVEALSQYNKFGDITGCNCFPVAPDGMRQHIGVRDDGRVQDCPDPSVHAMGKYTEKMMNVGQGKMPIWMQVQAMAYENWFNPKHCPEMAGQTVDESKILYPTYEQLRFMAYDSIVHGATGLVFAMWRTPIDSDVWFDIKLVVTELRGLNEALSAPPCAVPVSVSYTDLGYTIWDGVRTLARQKGDYIYLFSANTAFDPAQVKITVAGLSKDTVAFVEAEDREVVIENGVLSDTFKPYEVHIYRIQIAK